jgi:hypothetical protein
MLLQRFSTTVLHAVSGLTLKRTTVGRPHFWQGGAEDTIWATPRNYSNTKITVLLLKIPACARPPMTDQRGSTFEPTGNRRDRVSRLRGQSACLAIRS